MKSEPWTAPQIVDNFEKVRVRQVRDAVGSQCPEGGYAGMVSPSVPKAINLLAIGCSALTFLSRSLSTDWGSANFYCPSYGDVAVCPTFVSVQFTGYSLLTNAAFSKYNYFLLFLSLL